MLVKHKNLTTFVNEKQTPGDFGVNQYFIFIFAPLSARSFSLAVGTLNVVIWYHFTHELLVIFAARNSTRLMSLSGMFSKRCILRRILNVLLKKNVQLYEVGGNFGLPSYIRDKVRPVFLAGPNRYVRN